MKQNKFALACAVLLSLAGCGMAPSEEDVRAALQAQMGDVFKEEIAKTKLLGCAKADAGGYRCDLNGPLGALGLRFVKSDSGWVAIANGG